MALGGIDPLFNVYSKVTDTLMYLDERYKLDFYVQLMRKNRDGKVMPMHSEYEFYNQNLGQNVVSVRRNFSYGVLLNCIGDFENSIVIKPKDIPVIKYLMNTRIIPWYLSGNKRIFKLIDGKLSLISNDQVEIPLSERSMIIFAPMVIDYSDDSSKEGCRLYINDFGNYINMSLDKLMELNYYLCNTDFYNAALSVLNYIKSGPYGVNRSSVDISRNERSSSYFDKG